MTKGDGPFFLMSFLFTAQFSRQLFISCVIDRSQLLPLSMRTGHCSQGRTQTRVILSPPPQAASVYAKALNPGGMPDLGMDVTHVT